MNFLRYESFWFRNLLLATIMSMALQFSNSYSPSPYPKLQILGYGMVFFLFIALHNHFLLYRFFIKKRFITYFSLTFIYALAWNTIFTTWQNKTPGVTEDNIRFSENLFSTVFMLCLASGLFFIHLWITDNIVNTRKMLLRTESELRALKLQMNPHFLLNALNNLYAVAQTDPQRIKEKILELSALMSYQLEASKKEWVSLQEELEYCDQYINHMAWRTNNLHITRDTYGSVRNHRITPMVFQPIIENAIKNAVESPYPTVTISWFLDSRTLHMTVTNSFVTDRYVFGTKTGLNNLRRRLELYHPDHRLTTREQNNIFTTELKIWNLCTDA